MIAARRILLAAVACAASIAAESAPADTTTIEDGADGVRYQVTRRTMQVAVPQVANQQQTVYRQQLTTQTLQQQQLYTVPVTQYQLVSRLHGRWNPFVTPYWTHRYEPVTVWQQQTATVQIPVSTLAWTPETRTVQVPTTTYRSVEAIAKVPIGVVPGATASQPLMASAAGTTAPTATLTARPGATTTASAAATTPAPMVATAPAGPTYYGRAMTSDPPRQGPGWHAAAPDSRYR